MKKILLVILSLFLSAPSFATYSLEMDCVNKQFLDKDGKADLLSFRFQTGDQKVGIRLTYLPHGTKLKEAVMFGKAVDTAIFSLNDDLNIPIQHTFEELMIRHQNGDFPYYRVGFSLSDLFELTGPVWKNKKLNIHTRRLAYWGFARDYINEFEKDIKKLPPRLRKRYDKANLERISELLPDDEDLFCGSQEAISKLLSSKNLTVTF